MILELTLNVICFNSRKAIIDECWCTAAIYSLANGKKSRSDARATADLNCRCFNLLVYCYYHKCMYCLRTPTSIMFKLSMFFYNYWSCHNDIVNRNRKPKRTMEVNWNRVWLQVFIFFKRETLSHLTHCRTHYLLKLIFFSYKFIYVVFPSPISKTRERYYV